MRSKRSGGRGKWPQNWGGWEPKSGRSGNGCRFVVGTLEAMGKPQGEPLRSGGDRNPTLERLTNGAREIFVSKTEAKERIGERNDRRYCAIRDLDG
jgi:hypothetical protein